MKTWSGHNFALISLERIIQILVIVKCFKSHSCLTGVAAVTPVKYECDTQ